MKINNLLPFVSENFITFPLHEEVNYTPSINIWFHFNKLPKEMENTDELTINLPNIINFNVYIEVRKIQTKPIEFLGHTIATKEYYCVYFDIRKKINISDNIIDIELSLQLAHEIINHYTAIKCQHH